MASPGRTSLVLAAAIVLPTLIFASLQIASGYRDLSNAIEDATIDRARAIIGEADARLNGVRAALGVLTTIRSIDERDWAEARERTREIMALDPDWRAMRLIDVESRTEIFDTRRPLGAPVPIDALPHHDPSRPITVGGVAPEFMGCPCVSVVTPVRRGDRAPYLFVLALDAKTFQALTMAAAPKEGVTAIVDAKGRFISRTMSFDDLVGRPASTFVRDAIERGGSGVYQGVTLEGLANFSAFLTSAETGWSSHVAVSSGLMDRSRRGWWTATAIAALVSLALAAAMAWFGVRSLAEQRRAAEQMERTARAEAIGKLAGGMAHDFNNMLTIVISSLDLLRRRLEAGRTDVMRYVDSASEGATRAADLTRKMLAFSRRQPLEPKSIDVNALVAETRDLLERTIPASIRITLELHATWNVFADPRQLENALVNLAVNARDAMPDGGELLIFTLDAHDRIGSKERQDVVQIAVRDTGAGMTASVAEHAFEPFFTTKDVGKGTGLGLSQVHGFVHQSGGRVELRSQPDVGTEVFMILPRAPDAAPPARQAAPAEGLPSGSAEEVVLVVEDEERVLKAAVETLTELGYTVRHAPDGPTALSLLGAAPEVRLLFTDVVMPGMNGRELARRATALRPRLKVLFATGYERDPAPSDTSWTVLTKPYSLDDLARGVRATLDG